jgi:poly(beta-D-mannuronate) lyase
MGLALVALTRFDRDSSGSTQPPKTYDFTDTSARYVRIVGNGNTQNDSTSITEADIYAR